MFQVSVFGLQTGGELIARCRHMYGATVVSDELHDFVARNQIGVSAAAALLRNNNPDLVFVDSFKPFNAPYCDELTDPADTGLYDAVLTSMVQPAASVMLRLPGDRLRALVDDLQASGLYDTVSIQRALEG